MEDEDSVQTVQDLLNRFRGGGGEAAENKKREYQRSQSDSTDSPKTPRKDEAFPALSGKYILRSARTEDPLHFIHRIRQHSHELEGDRDPEMEDLVTIIRSAATDDLEEVSEQRESLYQDSVITAPLVKQFNPLPSEEPAHRGKKAAHHEVPVPRPRNLERSPKPPLASFDSDLELEDSPGPKVKDQSHDQSHDFQWRSHDSDDDDEESSEVSQSDDSYDDDDDNNPDNNNDDKEEKIEDARQSSDENEFEQASESDEKRPRESQSESSDHVFTMTTEEEEEPMSVKEQLADWEEEKERPEQEEEEDDGSDDVIGDLETVSTEIDKRKLQEILAQMATQVKFGTRRNAYEICIRPLRDRGDYEDLKVSVKSLVSVFENDADGDTDDDERVGQTISTERSVNVTVKKSSKDGGSLPDLVICSQYEDDFDGSNVTKSETLSLANLAANLSSGACYDGTDDAVLFETLKDMFERPPKKCKKFTNVDKLNQKQQRIKLPKNVMRSKSFQEQVKEIFSQSAAAGEDYQHRGSHSTADNGVSADDIDSHTPRKELPLPVTELNKEVVNIVLVESGAKGWAQRPKPPIPPVTKRTRNRKQQQQLHVAHDNRVIDTYHSVLHELGHQLGQEHQKEADTDSFEEDGEEEEEEYAPFGYWLTKERASNSSLDATELDFSVIETSNPLNHEASRQKVILRQKGSLAKRRKPTRSSIRASGMDHDLYGESMATEPRRHPIPPNMMNGHDVEAMERSRSRSHKSSSGSSEEEQERAEEREDTQAGPALRTGKAIGGVKTPILLPGLGDALNKPKLRSSRPPVPPPGESTSSPPVDNTPPWLVEARLRRASKPSAAPPRGEAEKMKQETEPEKPPWMKESMARRKRLIEPPKYGRPDPTKDTTEEQPLAPWMREENLQRSNRPAPLKASHSIVTNSDKSKTESVQQDSDMVSDNKDTSLDLESPRTRTGREVLSPIRHTPAPPMEETEQDENTPPIGQDRNENLMFPSEELPQKSTLPPLRSSPAPQSTNKDHGSETDDSPQPSWMAEIAARRKSKSYIHPVKPDSPMKLVETPQWKLDLAEKKKLRRESQPDIVIPPKVEESSPSSSVPPWKQELDQRKKRTSIGGGRVLDPLPTEKTEEVPEWTKLVQRRRSRLANSGIIRTDQEDVSQ